jgi:hypothetical protein
MGASQWWLGCYVSDSEYDEILPEFKKAEAKAVLSNEAIAGIELWKQNQENPEWLDNRSSNDFLCAFDLPGFREFGESELFLSKVTEENTHRFIIVNVFTPVSILWYALGYKNSKRLPGKMGNFIVRSTEVENTLKLINEIFDSLDQEELVSKAMKYAGSRTDKERVKEIITMLPDGLEKALEKKTGIIFLARHY